MFVRFLLPHSYLHWHVGSARVHDGISVVAESPDTRVCLDSQY